MKTAILIATLVALSPSAHAADTPLVRVTKDVTFLAPGRSEKLDMYLPAQRGPNVRSPALVWIHGGGFVGGTKNESRASEICTTAAAHGYVAVSIDYHLGEGAWPQALFDSKNAVRFLRANAAHYQVDPDRIAVAGGSAGGFLALMVGFTTGDVALEPSAPYAGVSDAVRCVIDMYGPIRIGVRDTKATSDHFGTPAVRSVSSFAYLKKDAPPVLILHGRVDGTGNYRGSEELAQALEANGVEHQLVLLDGVGHTFDWETWKGKPLPFDLRPIALAFLDKHTGERSSAR